MSPLINSFQSFNSWNVKRIVARYLHTVKENDNNVNNLLLLCQRRKFSGWIGFCPRPGLWKKKSTSFFFYLKEGNLVLMGFSPRPGRLNSQLTAVVRSPNTVTYLAWTSILPFPISLSFIPQTNLAGSIWVYSPILGMKTNVNATLHFLWKILLPFFRVTHMVCVHIFRPLSPSLISMLGGSMKRLPMAKIDL